MEGGGRESEHAAVAAVPGRERQFRQEKSCTILVESSVLVARGASPSYKS